MRKRKIRLLAGLICMVLIFFDIIPTGFQVSANEVEQEDSDANADDLGEEGALEDELTENDGEGADSGELDTENGGGVDIEEEELVNDEADDGPQDEADNVENEPENSEKEEEQEQETPNNEEGNINDEKYISINSVSSLSAEERLESMLSGNDIAYGTDGDIAWVIDADGKLTVEGSGDFIGHKGDNYEERVAPWYENRLSIISAEISITDMTDASYIFYGCNNLQSVDLSSVDTSRVTDMTYMFGACYDLQNLDLSKFDTSNVTNMNSMFDGCMSLQSLDVSKFDTSNVTDMFYMFCFCSGLRELDLSNFDTSNVRYMNGMFRDCRDLQNLDVSKFDTSNVQAMVHMFSGCDSLRELDLSNFNTSNVTGMSDMFSYSDNLQSVNLSSFDTSKVTDMQIMFDGCSSLQSLDLSNFDTSNVTNMGYMFSGCHSLQSLDLSNFNVMNVTNMEDMFNECTELSTIYTPYNINVSIELPTNTGDYWCLPDGSTVTEMPRNLRYSIVLMKNYISDEKLQYVKNLTQVSLKNIDADSKESIESAIYNLLFKAEYRPTKSNIPGDTMVFTGTKDTIARWPIQNKDPYGRKINDSVLGTVKWNHGSAGCMSYACFASAYIYGTNGASKKSSNLNADGVKEFIHQYADPGEQLRYNKPHSIVFLGESPDGDGFYYISYGGGISKRGVSHTLYLAEYTSYENFASVVKKYGNNLYIWDTNHGSYYNGTARAVTDVRSGNGVEKIVMWIACPVEAAIELNGEVLDSLSLGTADFGTVERDGDEIIFNLEYSPDYNLAITGTGEGSMSLTLAYYDAADNLIDKRAFVNVPIEGSTEIQTSGFESQSDFVLYVSDATNEMDIWGAGIGETVYEPDDIYRTANEPENDKSDDNEESGVLPEDIPSDGIIPDGIWSAGISDMIYTGSNITQSFRLYDGNKRLQEKVDYTVSYKNNKSAYTYTEEEYADFESNLQNAGQTKYSSFDPKKAPQVIIKMKGNYSGSRIIYFRIQPADISGAGFIANDLAVTYTGKKQTPTPTLTWNGKTLKCNTDFYIPKYDNAKNDKNAFSESKTYDLMIVGKNNFTGEIPITLTISANSKQIAMSSVTIKGISNQAWTGQQILPAGYTVKYKTDVLSEGNSDYTVSIGENTDVGIGTIILKGTGTDDDEDGYSYIGSKIVSFKITGTAMSKVTVSGVDKSYAYTGTSIEPNATLTYKANKNADPVILEKGIHYTVTYQKNQDRGTATIIFTGLESGGYTGTKKTTFKIVAGGIADKIEGGNRLEKILITYQDIENVKDGIYEAPYMKGGAMPKVIVTSGDKTLILGKDYTVSYANNKKVALSTDAKAPTITVKGKGNYSGSKKATFTIAAKPLSEESGITVVAKDKVANTKKNGYRQNFKVYDADGKALGSSDYDTRNVVYTLIQTKDESGTVKTVNETLDKESIVPADSVIRIEVQGKGNYIGGSVSGTYRILKKDCDISKATIKISNQEYTGQPVEITDQSQFMEGKVYLKVGSEKKVLTLGEDIEVMPDSYIKNINIGTAKVTFRGINEFGGEKTVGYKIGTRSIADFWKGVFNKLSELMAYVEMQSELELTVTI